MRRWLAEAVGTGLLLYVIVGSGIAAETLGGDPVTQLLAHALVVGLGLAVLIALFQTISGSHFNPSVTLAFWRSGEVDDRDATGYVVAQVLAGIAGVALANVTFGLPTGAVSSISRDGSGLVVAEGVATFVLVLIILILVRTDRPGYVPAAVGAWVAVAVFATASTGFANPAVTLARMFTDSYTGIAPSSAPWFLVAQLLAGFAAALVATAFYPEDKPQTANL